MVDYREILRLAHENCSQRSIAASIHSSHHTVSETLKAAKEKHIEWPLDETVTNAQLEEILFPNKYYLHCNYLPTAIICRLILNTSTKSWQSPV